VSVVSGLCLVQIPLDIRKRLLLRSATLSALCIIAAVIVVDSLGRRSVEKAVTSLLVAFGVVSVYAALHKVSPRSLGFGDVLLVAPLALAVEYVAPGNALLWQLLAASSGALHALIARLRSGSTEVPFGPHLLGTAWIVLVVSV
jgi:prepilin signal peptidase PulO-like enzyme (type II secretory pathway)